MNARPWALAAVEIGVAPPQHEKSPPRMQVTMKHPQVVVTAKIFVEVWWSQPPVDRGIRRRSEQNFVRTPPAPASAVGSCAAQACRGSVPRLGVGHLPMILHLPALHTTHMPHPTTTPHALTPSPAHKPGTCSAMQVPKSKTMQAICGRGRSHRSHLFPIPLPTTTPRMRGMNMKSPMHTHHARVLCLYRAPIGTGWNFRCEPPQNFGSRAAGMIFPAFGVRAWQGPLANFGHSPRPAPFGARIIRRVTALGGWKSAAGQWGAIANKIPVVASFRCNHGPKSGSNI